jgi:hypothetical protein
LKCFEQGGNMLKFLKIFQFFCFVESFREEL